MKLNLKVFMNKANGQTAIHLPKKIFKVVPEQIQIQVPKNLIKKQFRGFR